MRRLTKVLTGHQCDYCPPPFRRKAEGHSFRHSVLPSVLPHKQMGTPVAIKFGQLDTQVVIFEYKCDLFRKFDT